MSYRTSRRRKQSGPRTKRHGHLPATYERTTRILKRIVWYEMRTSLEGFRRLLAPYLYGSYS